MSHPADGRARHEPPAQGAARKRETEERRDREAPFEPGKSEEDEHLGDDAEGHSRTRHRGRKPAIAYEGAVQLVGRGSCLVHGAGGEKHDADVDR